MTTANREISDLQDYMYTGTNGTNITEAEVKAAARTLAGITAKQIEKSSDDRAEVEKGCLGEALLALGLTSELSVRGEIARVAWRNDVGLPV